MPAGARSDIVSARMDEPRPAAATPASAAPLAMETVTRPEPGLARGRWEAPAWAFWVALALVLLGAAGYLLHRLGYLGRRREKADAAGARSTTIRRP